LHQPPTLWKHRTAVLAPVIATLQYLFQSLLTGSIVAAHGKPATAGLDIDFQITLRRIIAHAFSKTQSAFANFLPLLKIKYETQVC
jgi:hypothetical protein